MAATSCIRLIFEVFPTCLKSIEENSSVCYHRTRQRSKNQSGGVGQLKESVYKTYEDLPLFLNAATVAKALGVSPSSGYELMLVVAKSTPLHPAYMPGIRSAPLLLLSP